MKWHRFAIGIVVVVALLTVGTAGERAAGQGRFTIKIGSKNFTEQFILAEMYAQALEAKGYQVERSINLGGTLIAHQALVSGKIDMYPEYTGTALAAVVKGTISSDPDAVYKQVKEFYESKLELTLLKPSKMNNGYILALLPETAQKYRLKTMTDLAKVSNQLVLGAGPEWRDRDDGLPGLKRHYGIEFKEYRPMVIALKYQALKEKQVDVVNGFGTDGQISAMKLARLQDDKNFWPPYRVAPVIRRDIARNYPGIVAILNAVTDLLTDEGQSELNWRVDGQKEEPRDVARDFLKKHGLAK